MKAIICDFTNTIYNEYKILIETFKIVSDKNPYEFLLKVLELEEKEEDWEKVLEKVLEEFGVKEKEKFFKFLKENKILNKKVIYFIKEFEKKGYDIIIFTKDKEALKFKYLFKVKEIIFTKKPNIKKLKELKEKYEEIIYIGDSFKEDLLPCKALGIKFIQVVYSDSVIIEEL